MNIKNKLSILLVFILVIPVGMYFFIKNQEPSYTPGDINLSKESLPERFKYNKKLSGIYPEYKRTAYFYQHPDSFTIPGQPGKFYKYDVFELSQHDSKESITNLERRILDIASTPKRNESVKKFTYLGAIGTLIYYDVSNSSVEYSLVWQVEGKSILMDLTVPKNEYTPEEVVGILRTLIGVDGIIMKEKETSGTMIQFIN